MKYFAPWTALLLCAGTLGATAQAPATSAEPVKVGVVAFQAAVTQTNEFQRDFADLQKKYEPKRQELKTLSDQIEALKKQLQTQGATLNDAERESRTRSITEKETKFKRDQEDDQNDFEQDMQQTFNSVASKVGDTLIDYAQKQGYTLVIDGGNQEAQVVLYATEATNITKAILDAYNTKSGVPAPAAQSATARPAAQHPTAARPAVKH
jgi:outer membrane protein